MDHGTDGGGHVPDLSRYRCIKIPDGKVVHIVTYVNPHWYRSWCGRAYRRHEVVGAEWATCLECLGSVA